jgi:hypothetical protein
MTGHGWPFSQMPDGYLLEGLDEADSDQYDREAREDRLADHAPATHGWPLATVTS